MKNLFLLALIIAAAIFSLWRPLSLFAAGDGTQVNFQIHLCNYNAICEPEFGENYLGCAMDCAAPPTPTPTSTPSSGGTSGGYPYPFVIPGSVVVTVTAHSAIISWSTYVQSLGFLSWGRYSDTELGTIAEINYGTNHRIQLDNLSPATRYLFRIEMRSMHNRSSFFGTASFSTLSETILPTNVRNFRFNIINSEALLSWINPTENNFQSVRLLRSKNIFPISPDDGQVLYEGSGTSYLDTDVKEDQDYYYSIFAENLDGAFSSGAVLHLLLRGSNSENENLNPLGFLLPPNSPNTIPAVNLNIEQNKQSLLFLDYIATAVTLRPITFSLLTNPNFIGVQSVVLRVEDEEVPGVYHAYLLRSNDDGEALQATIPPFQKSGNYGFSLDVLRTGSPGFQHLSGTLLVKDSTSENSDNFWQKIMAYIIAFFKAIARFLAIF